MGKYICALYYVKQRLVELSRDFRLSCYPFVPPYSRGGAVSYHAYIAPAILFDERTWLSARLQSCVFFLPLQALCDVALKNPVPLAKRTVRSSSKPFRPTKVGKLAWGVRRPD